ncbi:hypothetical protein ACFYZH_10030 [Streptomyces abikoensis]|uniref:hypothetical protein n=1 Tax=Streptomyces abikoensis TaxID=97398 RepID=UPI0036B90C85
MKKTMPAKKAEATNAPSEFEFKDVTYVVQSKKKLPLALLEAIEEDRGEIQIVRAIVGQEQWAAFKASDPTIEDFEEFAALVSEAAGFGDTGN